MADETPSEKAERRLAEAVRASGLMDERDLDWALALKRHAAARGKELPLDRILMKFELLSQEQLDSLSLALRYHVWRKEDKFWAKIAVQSDVMPQDAATSCLKEQKRLYRSDGRLRRVNAIAAELGLVTPTEDRAILGAMKKVRAVTLVPQDAAPPEPKPARPLKLASMQSRSGSGVGEVMVKSRSSASGSGPPSSFEDSDDALEPAELDRKRMNGAKAGEEREWLEKARKRDLAELSDALDLDRKPTKSGGAKSGGGAAKRPVSDEDLDALWDEADLDDIELDSEARDVARGAGGGAAVRRDDDDDVLDMLDDEDSAPRRR